MNTLLYHNNDHDEYHKYRYEIYLEDAQQGMFDISEAIKACRRQELYSIQVEYFPFHALRSSHTSFSFLVFFPSQANTYNFFSSHALKVDPLSTR